MLRTKRNRFLHCTSEMVSCIRTVCTKVFNGAILSPQILETQKGLFFHLHQQRLIELIRQGKTEEALDFATDHLAAQGEENPEFLAELGGCRLWFGCGLHRREWRLPWHDGVLCGVLRLCATSRSQCSDGCLLHASLRARVAS